MEYDYVVIGAGASGLSFAALMEKAGYSVAVLEAHGVPGGCSSYFERDGFIFDAGATTLSGLKNQRPIKRLIDRLNLKCEIISIDPGIVSLFGDTAIRRFKDPVKWIDELNRHFPGIDHQKLWGHLSKLEKKGWDLSLTFKNIPLRSIGGLFSFFSSKLPTALLCIPSLLRSVDSELEKFNIHDKKYLSLINEMLFITAQNNSADTPLLMGAMGLCYPEDTNYAMGGMRGFSEALASKCSHLFYRNIVTKISPIDNGSGGFEVETSKGKYKSRNLVSSIPIWNHAELFQDKLNYFKSDALADPDSCWSAFMIYLTVPLNSDRESIYYQVHCDEIPNCSSKSFFVSLSHPADLLRSKDGRQTVTISTHTRAAQWFNLDKKEYALKKEQTSQFIFKILREKFQLEESDLQNISTGSPKSFVRFTKRYLGLVGGIPYSLKRNPLDYILAKSPYKNFYMIGDTQFPGQGIAAVIMGAMNLVDYCSSKKVTIPVERE